VEAKPSGVEAKPSVARRKDRADPQTGENLVFLGVHGRESRIDSIVESAQVQ